MPAAAIVKVDGDGKWIWGYDLVAQGAQISRVVTAPNDDTLYAGYFVGAADLGGGLIPAIDGGATRPTAFVARRGF